MIKELKKSDIFEKFFSIFTTIYKDKSKRDNPECYLDFESSLKKYIDANPKHTADAKAKTAQYFTILNRIEYVICLDAKYSDKGFLSFWRKLNTLYNLINRSADIKDPIEVYFDNQIGIIEVTTDYTKEERKRTTKIAEGKAPYATYQLDILAIIAARNEHEVETGILIKEFEDKINMFFEYIKASSEGARLIVKIKSHVSEAEIYDDFGEIYRRYRALNRSKVGNYFFKEMDDLVDKLCDDFEKKIFE